MISHAADVDVSTVRENYALVHDSFLQMGDDEVRQRADALASSYLDQGITFGVEGEERPFPLDIVPRLIESEQWAHVDQGVRQRVRALEAFLADVYGPAELFADGVMPALGGHDVAALPPRRRRTRAAERGPHPRGRSRPDP